MSDPAPVPTSLAIRPASPDDAAAVAAIYNHYVLHTVVTFEETTVPDGEMRERIVATTAGFPWLVLEQDGRVAGYAYAARWKTRASYRHSLESTIYLAPDAVGRGLGRPLYEALLAEVARLDPHVVIGGITLPNPASEALHEGLGFRKVAHFTEVGWKFGRWLDVGYWQLTLTRRG